MVRFFSFKVASLWHDLRDGLSEASHLLIFRTWIHANCQTLVMLSCICHPEDKHWTNDLSHWSGTEYLLQSREITRQPLQVDKLVKISFVLSKIFQHLCEVSTNKLSMWALIMRLEMPSYSNIVEATWFYWHFQTAQGRHQAKGKSVIPHNVFCHASLLPESRNLSFELSFQAIFYACYVTRSGLHQLHANFSVPGTKGHLKPFLVTHHHGLDIKQTRRDIVAQAQPNSFLKTRRAAIPVIPALSS